MSWQLLKLVFLILALVFISNVVDRIDARGNTVPPAPPKNMPLSRSVEAPTTVAPDRSVEARTKAEPDSPSSTSASLSVASAQFKPWDTPEWKNCLANFKRNAKPGMYPKEQRLVDGKCIPSSLPTNLPNGACFMEAVSPSDLLSATKFETKLMCMRGKVPEMVCTDKKGHYMHAMTGGMAQDKKCDGFPNLLAIDMRKKGQNKALQEIFKDRKPNSSECERQVKTIRTLENDSRFDQDRRIRERWARESELDIQMRCQF